MSPYVYLKHHQLINEGIIYTPTQRSWHTWSRLTLVAIVEINWRELDPNGSALIMRIFWNCDVLNSLWFNVWNGYNHVFTIGLFVRHWTDTPGKPLVSLSLIWWHAWWFHQMEALSALLAICAGNSPALGEFPAQKNYLKNIARIERRYIIIYFNSSSQIDKRHLRRKFVNAQLPF